MTFSIMTLNIMAEYCYAECHVSPMLSVVILNVIILIVVGL
jgi:hypothetical protein